MAVVVIVAVSVADLVSAGSDLRAEGARTVVTVDPSNIAWAFAASDTARASLGLEARTCNVVSSACVLAMGRDCRIGLTVSDGGTCGE